ncbi:ATP synthase F0, B subunit [Chthoniobacter flavus Ellin428]|uniref:ATP synthase subunit b n=1 Tax=Chthoniobacter flavus Ellin428 TaxID=497964 RepID=B4D6F3_9BACT|nr:F0F1 ATP synthase subunit B [Chthoniobacter flavus]EDY18062.1 ATP synthase F0, B subunit [Chthoniobacter flavus Ellin428]TCO88303.1 F-type H+-transporting ATPase subunit b [Chthoniobacter flavus]
MTFLLPLAAEGGIIENLQKSAQETAEVFGVNAWALFSQIISFSIVAFLLHKLAYKPILNVLEERRKKIAEGLANAEKIKVQLAESEARVQEILTKANVDAQRLIDEARASAQVVADRRTQQAIAEAEQIIAKAREATGIEREKIMAELKREVGRLVIDTTSRVTGKVLTQADQKRINEEASREVAA